MLELGLYIHPEDGAENQIDATTGDKALDKEASVKVDSIYAEMFKVLGEEETYDIGTTAWWTHQGYTWDEREGEWVKY